MDQIKRAYLVENRYFVKPAQNGELSATGQIRTEYSELMDRLLADPKEKGAADDSVPPLEEGQVRINPEDAPHPRTRR
jgi:hypothetical protein